MGYAIQALIAMLWGSFIAALPGIIGRILLALGFATVTYKGFGFVLNQFKDDLLARFSSLPLITIQFLGVLQVGTCVNIIFSAFLARATLDGYAAVSTRLQLIRATTPSPGL